MPVAPDGTEAPPLFHLVVDVSIVNVALPRIQHDLHFSHPGLAWVVTGYVLLTRSSVGCFW